MVMFGLGLVCWAFLGSIIFVRLVAHPLMPVGLRPTLAILVAPPAVAGQRLAHHQRRPGRRHRRWGSQGSVS